MGIKRLKALKIHIWGWLLLGVACVAEITPGADVPAPGFKLTNGNSVSDAGYDDYHPILLRLSNNFLVLVFASNRPCPTCGGGTHSIYIAPSVAAYQNDGKLPAFYPPQVILENAAAKSYSTRLRLAATVSGTTFNIYIKDSSGIISETGAITAVANVSPDVFGSANNIAAYNCYSGTMLGLDATGQMISTAGTSGPISRYNPASALPFCPTNVLSNTAMASAVNISYVRSADIGINEGFLVTDTAGRLSAHTATVKGPYLLGFNDFLAGSGLYLTSATAFLAGQSAGDLLVFSASAGAGLPSDLYIIANKTPAALWLKYTKFGAQPVP
ncbi:MAG: hypothetical protein J0L53_00190 [Spirochaetes bacterium]|nr:hypothetical protein [Spirochaetota bacterium]